MDTFTNAMHNRAQAIRLLQAGYKTSEIANRFSEVFSVDNAGRLSQNYDYILDDGRMETNLAIASSVVDTMIAAKTKEGSS